MLIVAWQPERRPIAALSIHMEKAWQIQDFK
jgi:hypothetical protein